jgi:hypothetical protein
VRSTARGLLARTVCGQRTAAGAGRVDASAAVDVEGAVVEPWRLRKVAVLPLDDALASLEPGGTLDVPGRRIGERGATIPLGGATEQGATDALYLRWNTPAPDEATLWRLERSAVGPGRTRAAPTSGARAGDGSAAPEAAERTSRTPRRQRRSAPRTGRQPAAPPARPRRGAGAGPHPARGRGWAAPV